MTTVDVVVAVDGADVLAGTLCTHRRRGSESATFGYAASYLADDRAYALEPALGLRGGSQQTAVDRATFGAFSDGAPDRWGRQLLRRREAAQARAEGRTPRSLGELDMLLEVRDDLRQGAVRFRQDDGFLAEEDAGVPALTDLPELLDLAGRAERDDADLPDLQRLVRVGSSLGGA